MWTKCGQVKPTTVIARSAATWQLRYIAVTTLTTIYRLIFSSFAKTPVKYSGRGAKTMTGRPSRGWAKHRVPAWRHWLSCPNSAFLWP